MKNSTLFIPLTFLLALRIHAAPSTAPKASTANITTVEWITCPEGTPSLVECGQIQVPLDHAKPHGDVIPLVFTRLRSTSNSSTAPGLYV
jgi:hypothetical protein